MVAEKFSWMVIRLTRVHPFQNYSNDLLAGSELRNILTIDVEDYFQSNTFDQIIGAGWDRFESRVTNTEKF
jgi:hypothetical protein